MVKNDATVILFKDDSKKEVFLVYRSDYPVWATTGGGIEDNESPKEAAIREAYEETGFKIKITGHCGVYKIADHKSYLFKGRVISGKFRPEFPRCKGKWFSLNNLPKDIIKFKETQIFDAANHQGEPFDKKGRIFSLSDNYKLIIRHPFAFLKFCFTELKIRLT